MSDTPETLPDDIQEAEQDEGQDNTQLLLDEALVDLFEEEKSELVSKDEFTSQSKFQLFSEIDATNECFEVSKAFSVFMQEHKNECNKWEYLEKYFFSQHSGWKNHYDLFQTLFLLFFPNPSQEYSKTLISPAFYSLLADPKNKKTWPLFETPESNLAMMRFFDAIFCHYSELLFGDDKTTRTFTLLKQVFPNFLQQLTLTIPQRALPIVQQQTEPTAELSEEDLAKNKEKEKQEDLIKEDQRALFEKTKTNPLPCCFDHLFQLIFQRPEITPYIIEFLVTAQLPSISQEQLNRWTFEAITMPLCEGSIQLVNQLFLMGADPNHIQVIHKLNDNKDDSKSQRSANFSDAIFFQSSHVFNDSEAWENFGEEYRAWPQHKPYFLKKEWSVTSKPRMKTLKTKDTSPVFEKMVTLLKSHKVSMGKSVFFKQEYFSQLFRGSNIYTPLAVKFMEVNYDNTEELHELILAFEESIYIDAPYSEIYSDKNIDFHPLRYLPELTKNDENWLNEGERFFTLLEQHHLLTDFIGFLPSWFSKPLCLLFSENQSQKDLNQKSGQKCSTLSRSGFEIASGEIASSEMTPIEKATQNYFASLDAVKLENILKDFCEKFKASDADSFYRHQWVEIKNPERPIPQQLIKEGFNESDNYFSNFYRLYGFKKIEHEKNENEELSTEPDFCYLTDESVKQFCETFKITEHEEVKHWIEKIQHKTNPLIRNKPLASVGSAFEKMDTLREDFPHFGDILEQLRDHFALCRVGDGSFSLPPLLLVGPPGTGKTFFFQRLAAFSNVDYHLIQMESVNASFAVTGMEIGWGGSTSGFVFKNFMRSRCANPMMLLDEIDKNDHGISNGGSVENALLSLLEPHTAEIFTDRCVQLPIDVSKINWVATANYLERVSQPVQSRFNVIHVPQPDKYARIAMAKAIYRALRKSHQWGEFFSEILCDASLDLLTFDEGSARDLRKNLTTAFAKAALDGSKEVLPKHIPFKKSEKLIMPWDKRLPRKDKKDSQENKIELTGEAS